MTRPSPVCGPVPSTPSGLSAAHGDGATAWAAVARVAAAAEVIDRAESAEHRGRSLTVHVAPALDAVSLDAVDQLGSAVQAAAAAAGYRGGYDGPDAAFTAHGRHLSWYWSRDTTGPAVPAAARAAADRLNPGSWQITTDS